MHDVAQIAFFLAVAAAFPVWFVAVWSAIAMMRHRRDGSPWKLIFDPLWWLPERAAARFTEQGMRHYRRLMKAMGLFFGLVIAGSLVGRYMAVSQPG